MTTSARRTIVASLFGVAFVLPLALLLSVRVPATSQRQLVDESPRYQPLPVELPRTAYQQMGGVSYVHRVRLETRNVGQIANRAEIRLLVATHSTRPSLERGELAIGGTDCVYRTVRGAEFPNNAYLTFRRGSGCYPLRGTPTGEIRVTLRFSTPGRAALWTFTPPPDAPISGDAIRISDSALPQSYARPLVRGVVVDTYPTYSARRIELLAYVWQVSPSPRWIWIVLGCSGLLIWCAVFCFAAEPVQAVTGGWKWGARHAAGAFCAAAALSTTYAVMVPPFQAADEPNHFLGVLSLAGRLDLGNDATAWARLAHFERIQFHPDERFGPLDVGQPGATWNDGVAPDPGRGSGAAWVWQAFAGSITSFGVPRILLTLRLVHALLFSLAIAVSLALLTLTTGVRHPELMAIPLFLVPTLPFFGMHLSNYALLVDLYILLATGILIAFWDAERSYVAGPVIGAAWVAGVAVSRSAIPLAPLIAIVLVARLALGGRRQDVGSILIYWIGFSLWVMVGVAATVPEYVRSATSSVQTTLPGVVTATALLVVTHPWILLGLGALAAAAEYSLGVLRHGTGARFEPAFRTAARTVAGIAVLAGLAFLAGSVIFQYPGVNTIDPAHPPSAGQYAKDVTLAGLTAFRFGHPDFLTSVTFWGGFGWLDTLPSNLLVSALAGVSGLALVALLMWIARTGSIRSLVWLLSLFCAYVLTLMTYAVSVVRVTPADLHGRYLLGVYLCLLMVAWSSVSRFVEHTSIGRETFVVACLGVCCLGVHAYALSVIITRYF